MELIDSHAHIDGPQFDADRDADVFTPLAIGGASLYCPGPGNGINARKSQDEDVSVFRPQAAIKSDQL